MKMKYNKRILKQHTERIFGKYYTLYILDDKDYYNIHIVTDEYRDEEFNTLKLQEPKKDVSLNELDELYMTKLILEFALWSKFYGYKNKTYQFEIGSTIVLDV
jgi:hypothetical protein